MDSVINHFFPRETRPYRAGPLSIVTNSMYRVRRPGDSLAVANRIYYTPRLKTAKRSSGDASASHRPSPSFARSLSLDATMNHVTDRVSAIDSERTTIRGPLAIPEANYSGRGQTGPPVLSGVSGFKALTQLYGGSIGIDTPEGNATKYKQ